MNNSMLDLRLLCSELIDGELSQEQKCKIIQEFSECKEFLEARPELALFFDDLKVDMKLAALSLLAIGQGPRLFPDEMLSQDSKQCIVTLLQSLLPVEEFYKSMGGIVGYHAAVLSHLYHKVDSKPPQEYLKPVGVDISKSTALVRRWVREAIEKAGFVAEVYPVGGAGDRLNLIDKITHEPLPAAVLSFCGHTLLERLILDVAAREYLVYKLTGKKIETPICMMTSFEKHNHKRILEALAEKNWFGRSPSSFFLFTQPQVPVLDTSGNWLLQKPYELIFKPGGHGAIWTEADREGVFKSLKDLGVKKILAKQINNLVAGTDFGLLAFLGVGIMEEKAFGFNSCERRVNAHEGMCVVTEQKEKQWKYALTNVEYTEFEKKGINDVPQKEGSPYSIFPANTNILFADINVVEKEQKLCPIPGITVNMKSKFKTLDENGKQKEVLGGRLESTMQNIADGITDVFEEKLHSEEQHKLKTFLTYNERIKTISVIKKLRNEDSLLETPEGCLYDIMTNAEDLLKNYCRFDVPTLNENLPFIFLYHPALGPLYEIIGAKLRSGKLENGSELIIEVPEVDIEGLHVQGSLLITGSLEAKCRLKNVKVTNKGLGKSIDLSYWESPKRKESVNIILEDDAEFEAEDVHFEGPFEINVSKGVKAKAVMKDGKAYIVYEAKDASWSWSYFFDSEDRIVLKKSHDAENNPRSQKHSR